MHYDDVNSWLRKQDTNYLSNILPLLCHSYFQQFNEMIQFFLNTTSNLKGSSFNSQPSHFPVIPAKYPAQNSRPDSV